MLAKATGLMTGELKGELVTCVSVPPLPIENTEILLESRSATKRKFPEPSTSTYDGPVPGITEKGEPLTAVNPELPKENAETLFEPWLAVKTKPD